MSQLFKLNAKDFVRGAVVAVFAAVLSQLAGALNLPGFDFVTFDWASLLSVAGTAFVSYLTKNLLSDSNGAVLGKIG